MKKNISINICGTIYSIDEDAYELLFRYLDSMKRYFGNEGEEDIADDIEHRVAELLWERRQAGMEAVNLATVKDIIDKIGNPADIAGGSDCRADSDTAGHEATAAAEDAAAGETNADKSRSCDDGTCSRALTWLLSRIKGRHLYRNTKDKMVGGVCSGLAEYFGGDTVFWRLGFVVTVLLLWSFDGRWMPNFLLWLLPVVYAVLLVVVPEAKTPEDKIRMQGKDVNSDTLKEQIVNDIQEEDAPKQTTNYGSGCLRILFYCVLVLLAVPLFLLMALCVFGIVFLIAVTAGADAELFAFVPGLDTLSEVVSINAPYLWVGLVAGLVVVLLPVRAIISVMRGDSGKSSSGQVMAKIVVWVAALAVVVCCCIFGGVTTREYFNRVNRDSYERLQKEREALQEVDTVATENPAVAADSVTVEAASALPQL